MTPEEMVSRLLYRDGLMLVIDKPAGFAVHKGPKGGESLEDHFDALRFGLPRKPALAHRLDRDTSGCLVLGRHRKALATLGRLFKSGQVGKTYWAVVEGGPEQDEGRIELPLGRLDESRGWWMKHDPHGQPAVTTWKVMGRSQLASTHADDALCTAECTADATTSPPVLRGREEGHGKCRTPDHPPPHPSPSRVEGAHRTSDEVADTPRLTWLALEPLTGRTHQLRVHCAAMGWPIVGDAIYGTEASLRRLRKESPRNGGPGLHLYAREVVVPLYKNREPIKVSAPVPPHMHAMLQTCGRQGEASKLVD